MKSALARAAACLLSVTTLLGLGVAAAPAASAAACGGTVHTSGVIGVGVDVGYPTSGVWLCFDVAGQRRMIGVQEVYEVVEVLDTFVCESPIEGTIGDPAEPPYVDYRVAVRTYGSLTQPQQGDMVRICVGVGAVSRSVQLHVVPDPELVLQTGPTAEYHSCADGPRQDVGVYLPGGPGQTVATGATDDASGLCLYTYGTHTSCYVFSPYTDVSDALDDCAAIDTVRQALDDALGDLLETAGEVAEDAEEAVDDAVNDALARVHAVVDPIVATVLAEAGEAVAVVNGVVDDVADLLPVQVSSTLGNCSLSVTSVGAPANVEVRRSPTGQVPASVCVVAGGSVVRLTVG